MSLLQFNNDSLNFPATPNYGVLSHRFSGVPKHGRAPPSMWGNQLCPREKIEQKKNEANAIGSRMKIKRTSTPKISNESNSSPMLSAKKKNEILFHTALNDIEILHKELNGKSDKAYLMLVKILCSVSEEKRINFVNRYNATYPENLEDRLLENTPPEAYNLIQSLLFPSEKIMIQSFHNAVEKGTGAIELSLIEILFLSSDEQKQRYIQEYPQMYPGSSLQQDIVTNTDSNLRKLCLALLQNQKKAMENNGLAQTKTDVKELIDASKSDRAEIIIDILTTNSNTQISLFIQEFYQTYGEKLSAFISNGIPKTHRFGDLFIPSLKLIISLVEDPIKCKAVKLSQTLISLSTVLNAKGLDVTRRKQVVHRMFLVDHQEMKEIGDKMEGKALEGLIEDIQEVCYRNMLLTFVRDNGWY